jgi:hypothetical protein
LAPSFPEAPEAAELAALVLGTFPGAGVEAVLNRRPLAGTAAPTVASASTVALLNVGAVLPNPAVGRALILFELAEEATVEAVLYDVLGRRVAVLASGPYGAGRHALTLDGAALPAGVYVVYVAARSSAGAPAVAARRVTITR